MEGGREGEALEGRNVLTRKLPLSLAATDANWGVDGSGGWGGSRKRKHTLAVVR